MQTELALAGLLGMALASPSEPSTVTEVVSTITATVSVTASPTIFSAVPQFIDNATFTYAVLNSTNTWRSQYNASKVSWNQTLAAFASSYLASMGPLALENGTECNFAHSGGPYGENIALGCTDVTGCVDLCEPTLSRPTSSWRPHPFAFMCWRTVKTDSVAAGGNEVKMYNYKQPNFSEETGHFTQLVWKNTTTVGCGSRLCGLKQWYDTMDGAICLQFTPTDSARYFVCEYWPRGNVIGDFGSMVGRQANSSGWINTTSPMRSWYVVSLVFLTVLWLIT